MLKEIGKSIYGTKYAMQGIIPFNLPRNVELKWGDVIIDNDGKGMCMYVNECSTCQKKFLGGTLICVFYECEGCSRETIMMSLSRKGKLSGKAPSQQ